MRTPPLIMIKGGFPDTLGTAQSVLTPWGQLRVS
jgi:hypothetical protein